MSIDGDIVSEYNIPPQGMIVAVSKEEFKMPPDIIGFTTVKNSLSSQGVLALNIGLVDPTWNGPISSVLINFGRRAHKIKTGDRFLRMTFFKFSILEQGVKYNFPQYALNNYLSMIKNEAGAYLEKTFLNLDNTLDNLKKEVFKKVRNQALALAGSIVTITGILSFLFSTNDWLKLSNIGNAISRPSVLTDVEQTKNQIHSLAVSDSIILQKISFLDSLQRIKMVSQKQIMH